MTKNLGFIKKNALEGTLARLGATQQANRSGCWLDWFTFWNI